MKHVRPYLATVAKQFQDRNPSQVVYLNYIKESVDLVDTTDAEYIDAAIKIDTMKMKGQIGYELPIEVYLCDTDTPDSVAVITVIDRSELPTGISL